MAKFWHVVLKLEKIKNELSNHSSVYTTVKYFKLAKSCFFFGKSHVTCKKVQVPRQQT